MLQLTDERCPGRPVDAKGRQECWGCTRRQQGISDYLDGVEGLVWREPAEQSPCPNRISECTACLAAECCDPAAHSHPCDYRIEVL
jgi:hypothetical protein